MPIGTRHTFPLRVKNIDQGVTLDSSALYLLQSVTISAARTTVSGTDFTATGLIVPAGAILSDVWIDLYAPLTACSVVVGTSASVAQFFTADLSAATSRVRGTPSVGAFLFMDTSMTADTTIECRVSVSGTTNPAAGAAFTIKALAR